MTTTPLAAAKPDGSVEVPPVTRWERINFGCLRAVVFALAKILTLPGLYRFGQAFAFCEWAINFKRRRRIARRLRWLLGDELSPRELRRATLGQVMHVRCNKLIYLIFDMLPAEQTIRRWEFSNRHILDDALARGNGAYVALCHHGAHHITGLMMSLLGYKVAGVRDRREGAIWRYVQNRYEVKYDELRHARIIYSDTFAREIFRCFKDNFALGSALDVYRDRGSNLKTTEVEFFGRKTPFLTGTVQIAMRCKTPILQGFVVCLPNFRYRFELHGPLADPAQTRESPETLQHVLQEYARNIETYVRRYPSQITKL